MNTTDTAAIDRLIMQTLESLHQHCGGDMDRALWMLQTHNRDRAGA